MTDNSSEQRLRDLARKIENLAISIKERQNTQNIELTNEQLQEMESLSNEFQKSIADLDITVNALAEIYKESD